MLPTSCLQTSQDRPDRWEIREAEDPDGSARDEESMPPPSLQPGSASLGPAAASEGISANTEGSGAGGTERGGAVAAFNQLQENLAREGDLAGLRLAAAQLLQSSARGIIGSKQSNRPAGDSGGAAAYERQKKMDQTGTPKSQKQGLVSDECSAAPSVSRSRNPPPIAPSRAAVAHVDFEADERRLFEIFDSDNTGKISMADLQNIAKDMGIPLSDEALSDLIEGADKDGDGEIDEEEFKYLLAEYGQQRSQPVREEPAGKGEDSFLDLEIQRGPTDYSNQRGHGGLQCAAFCYQLNTSGGIFRLS